MADANHCRIRQLKTQAQNIIAEKSKTTARPSLWPASQPASFSVIKSTPCGSYSDADRGLHFVARDPVFHVEASCNNLYAGGLRKLAFSRTLTVFLSRQKIIAANTITAMDFESSADAAPIVIWTAQRRFRFIHFFVHRRYFLGMFGDTWDTAHSTLLPMKEHLGAGERK